MAQNADPILASLPNTNLSAVAVVHNGIPCPTGTLTGVTIAINAAAVGSYVFTVYRQSGTSGTFSSLTTVTITNGNWSGSSSFTQAVTIGDTLRVALTTLPAGQTVTAPIDIIISWTRTVAADTAVTLTDGDKGDVSVSSGTITIDNDAVTYAKMQNVSATARILARKTASAGDVEEATLSEILDFIGSAAQGDILYRGSSAWARLGAGTSGQFLKTQGAGANPVWDNASGAVGTDAIWDAKGDLAVGTGANTAQKLTVGTNGHILYADSAETTGVKWAAPPSGTVPFNAASGSAAASLEFLEDTDNGAHKITVIGAASVASDKTQTLQDITDTFVYRTSEDTLTNKKVSLTAAHGTDDTYQGTQIPGLNNSGGVTQWDAVYLNSSSQWVIADANGSGTYPALGLAVSAETTGNPVTVLTYGTVRNDAWNWTVGGLVYLSTTAGGLTQTAPSTSGDKVQIIGVALTADILFVNPQLGYLTIT